MNGLYRDKVQILIQLEQVLIIFGYPCSICWMAGSRMCLVYAARDDLEIPNSSILCAGDISVGFDHWHSYCLIQKLFLRSSHDILSIFQLSTFSPPIIPTLKFESSTFHALSNIWKSNHGVRIALLYYFTLERKTYNHTIQTFLKHSVRFH